MNVCGEQKTTYEGRPMMCTAESDHHPGEHYFEFHTLRLVLEALEHGLYLDGQEVLCNLGSCSKVFSDAGRGFETGWLSRAAKHFRAKHPEVPELAALLRGEI